MVLLLITDANKLQIKKRIEEMYGVAVDRVNTMNYEGKTNQDTLKLVSYKEEQ